MGFFNFWKKKKSGTSAESPEKPKSLSEAFRSHKPEIEPFDPAKHHAAKIDLNNKLMTFNLTVVNRMKKEVEAHLNNQETNEHDIGVKTNYPLSDEDLSAMPQYRELHRICADTAIDVKVWSFSTSPSSSADTGSTYVYVTINRSYEYSSNLNCFKKRIQDDPAYTRPPSAPEKPSGP